jgi:hypothetical protein
VQNPAAGGALRIAERPMVRRRPLPIAPSRPAERGPRPTAVAAGATERGRSPAPAGAKRVSSYIHVNWNYRRYNPVGIWHAPSVAVADPIAGFQA